MQQADLARTVSGPTLLGLGPRALKGLGPGPPRAWGPGSQRLAGWFLCVSEIREKRFSPSPLLKPSNMPPKVGGGFRVSYDE